MTDRVEAHIEIRDLVVQRGGVSVLEIESLDIPRGLVTVMIGPNGSGKSTLLGALQLVLHPARGTLTLDGEAMDADPVKTRRRMSAAFQEPLLLSMSVQANVELPLRLRGVDRRRRRELAEHWLERFGIAALARRHARQLSGGEAQRVSLARAFASQPEVLLLDEPFSGVDAPTREGLIGDFAEIVSEARPTTVLVTHDRDEALRLGDHAALLIGGGLRQSGPPSEVFDRPADRAVAEFVGTENIWEGRRSESGVYQAGGVRLASTAKAVALGAPALLCVRPERIVLTREDDGSANQIRATVRAVRPRGPVIRSELASARLRLIADTPLTGWDELSLSVGDEVITRISPADVHVIEDTD
ncbi:MAG: ABC transporter ATP-binding protein [Chloroflexi bacterium]|nr:ABC transporter ATP-binding protein [Chloroflexota bacterium]MYF22834.1 ABC transporter ATP-binding protein [Chloroflexota bacterium]